MTKNVKTFVFCLCFVLLSLSVMAETGSYGPQPPYAKIIYSFFNRPIEVVKSDIFANMHNIKNHGYFIWNDVRIEGLDAAIPFANPKIVRFILENWDNIEEYNRIHYALVSAAMDGRDDLVEILLEYGADPNFAYCLSPLDNALIMYVGAISIRSRNYKFEINSYITPIENYVKTIQILWPITENKEERMDYWKKEFDTGLIEYYTQAEIEQEWNKFLSLTAASSNKN
jgi:hypothetical protein